MFIVLSYLVCGNLLQNLQETNTTLYLTLLGQQIGLTMCTSQIQCDKLATK